MTLRGPGGVGKTRLALQVAAAVRDIVRARGPGWSSCPRSAARDLLAPEVAKALGLPDVAPGDPDGALVKHLAESDLLLILDTCEHLVTACADLASALLAGCPGLRILATSREPLGVPGEQVMLISPLEVFAERDAARGPGGVRAKVSADDLAAIGRSEAVELFLDRARAAVPGYALTAANAGAVARLCRKLDGIPLAIELAAVRLRSMSAEEIAGRLDDRFRILGTARTLTGRHRTLRAAVRWSHELCTPAEQRLWERLSVFPGGFTSEAAEAVGGPATGRSSPGWPISRSSCGRPAPARAQARANRPGTGCWTPCGNSAPSCWPPVTAMTPAAGTATTSRPWSRRRRRRAPAPGRCAG